MFREVNEKLLADLWGKEETSIRVIATRSIKDTLNSYAFIQGKQYKLFIMNGITEPYVHAQFEVGKRNLISARGEGLKLASKYEGAFLWYDNSISEKYYVELELVLKPGEDETTFAVEWNRHDIEEQIKILGKRWISPEKVIIVAECRGSEDVKSLQATADRLYWSNIVSKQVSDIAIDIDLASCSIYKSN